MINVLKYLEKEDKCIECKGTGFLVEPIDKHPKVEKCTKCQNSGKQKTIWAIISAKCEWREKCEENCDSCHEVPCIESWDLKGSNFDFKLNTREKQDCFFSGGTYCNAAPTCWAFKPRIIKGKVLEAIRFEKASYSGFEGIIDKKDALSPKQHLWIINQGLKDGNYIFLICEKIAKEL